MRQPVVAINSRSALQILCNNPPPGYNVAASSRSTVVLRMPQALSRVPGHMYNCAQKAAGSCSYAFAFPATLLASPLPACYVHSDVAYLPGPPLCLCLDGVESGVLVKTFIMSKLPMLLCAAAAAAAV